MVVKRGYKQTDVGTIPDEWEVDTLASVTPRNVRNGIVDGPFGSNLKTIHYRKAGIPIVTSGYVTEGRFFADSYLYVDKQKFAEEKRSAVRPGDIVMAKIGARCGASAILPAGHPIGILSGNALKITVDETRHATFYVWQVLWNLYSEGNVEALRTVGAQPAISMANLKKHKIALPPQREQRAIAEALKDVDGLLGALDRLTTKKRDLKQAAMQQLLTGQIRLPGFHGEWEVKRLGDVVDTDPENLGRDTRRDFAFNYIALEDVDRGSLRSHSEQVFADAPSRARRKLRVRDVLVSTVRPNLQSHLFFGNEVGDWVCSTGFCVVRCRQGVTNPGYVFSHLFADGVNRQIDALLTGSNYPAINSGDVRALQIPIPDYDEQTAIAQVLTDMDAELAALEQRREKTRALKQAMMQELLTGKTRLV
jgi:type I restriction enzyme, S subunit